MIASWKARVHQNPSDVTNLQKMPRKRRIPLQPFWEGDRNFQERPLETSGLSFPLPLILHVEYLSISTFY